MKWYLKFAIIIEIFSGCAGLKSVFVAGQSDQTQKPISNPFGEYYPNAKSESSSLNSQANSQAIILRTKKGDRSVEVELSRGSQDMTDFVIPMSPSFKESGRSPASEGGSSEIDETYKERAPTISDREITRSMPSGAGENDGKRKDIEQGLYLIPSGDGVPERDKSYLASIDRIKQLYKISRYEAALIETDTLLQQYQTDPKIYEMRGTLLSQLGRADLAMQSWQQALRYDPKNLALKKFVERKQSKANGGSP